MMQSTSHMALGVISVAAIGAALFLRFEDTSSTTSEQRTGTENFCCIVEHPWISGGMVCADGPEGLVQKAIERLNLPEECSRISIPVNLPAGCRVVLDTREGKCAVERVTPLKGGERLLAGVGIDINTAKEADLVLLPGIGQVKAKAIVDHRRRNGPFRSIDELAAVHGIGDRTVEHLRPWVSVSGGSTGEERRKK
jgi:competence ComEA-like helix-hairpin-helix protein